MLSFIPKANPDFEDYYDSVITWYIEYDDTHGYPNREIGINTENEVIAKAPYLENLGIWTDSNILLSDFEKWNPTTIECEEFNKLWNMKIKHLTE